MVSYFRKAYLLSALVSCLFACAHATDQELFLRANQTYEAQQFDDALALYQKIEHKSAPAWFNMGICYARLHKIPDAWLCWRRVEQTLYLPLWARVQEYKKLVGIQTAVHKNHVVQAITTRWTRGLVYAGFWWLVCLWLCCFILAIILSLRPLTSYVRKILLVTAVGITIIVGCGIYHLKVLSQAHYALVKETAAVYNGPGQRFGKRAEIPALAESVVLKTQDGWNKLQFGTLQGWVPTQQLADDTNY